MEKKLYVIMVGWLLLLASINAVTALPPAIATFQVPITQIRAYTALYPDFFDKVELESEGDKGITYLGEIERREYILTAEEARNRTINYPKYIYDKTPDTEEEWLALAIFYLGDYRYKDNYQKAEEAAKTALGLNPDSFEAYAILFYIYDWYPQMGETGRVLQKLEILAKSAKHYGVLGSIYAGNGINPLSNSTKSRYFYERALEKDSNYAPAYSGLAAYYHYQAKNYSKAEEYLKKFLELRPGDSWALLLLEQYSSTYVPMEKRDPFTLVMIGIIGLFVLYAARAFWKSGKHS